MFKMQNMLFWIKRQFRMILKNFCETNYKRQSKIALSTYWWQLVQWSSAGMSTWMFKSVFRSTSGLFLSFNFGYHTDLHNTWLLSMVCSVHWVSCSAHVFAQKQHVWCTFVLTFTTQPNLGPTPAHSRLSDPELLQQLLCSSSLHLQHLLQSPQHRPLEYPCSHAQPESTRYQILIQVSLAAAQSIIRVEK